MFTPLARALRKEIHARFSQFGTVLKNEHGEAPFCSVLADKNIRLCQYVCE
jgi:hypothetical protein